MNFMWALNQKNILFHLENEGICVAEFKHNVCKQEVEKILKQVKK